jgi:cobalamin biosynthesis protein CobD/CbiB
MVKEFAARHGSALRSLAMLVGFLATTAAIVVAAILAVIAAATVAVIAVMASALLGFAGLALRARRTVQARRSDGVIEARHLGGHHWVAYGWNESR